MLVYLLQQESPQYELCGNKVVSLHDILLLKIRGPPFAAHWGKKRWHCLRVEPRCLFASYRNFCCFCGVIYFSLIRLLSTAFVSIENCTFTTGGTMLCRSPSIMQIPTPIKFSTLFPPLQGAHKFSDEFMEQRTCDLSSSKFTFYGRQHRKKTFLVITTALQCSAMSSWAQWNFSTHWQDTLFHLSRAMATFWACCKVQGSNSLLFKQVLQQTRADHLPGPWHPWIWKVWVLQWWRTHQTHIVFSFRLRCERNGPRPFESKW